MRRYIKTPQLEGVYNFSFFNLIYSMGGDEVKYSIGLLQGPGLMTWTTKSQNLGNHWVPLRCRALLGSVEFVIFFFLGGATFYKFEHCVGVA